MPLTSTNQPTTLTLRLKMRRWVQRVILIAGLGILPASSLRPFLVVRAATPAAIPPGLVGWWPADGDGDDLAGANHALVPIGVDFTSGKLGMAFHFPNLDDHRNKRGESPEAIRIPGFGLKLPSSEITISFWQKARIDQVQYSVSLSPYDFKHVCRCIATYPDGMIVFDFGNNHAGGQLSYIPPESILGTWQHFTFVASQKENFMKTYRNGILEAQKTGMTPFENVSSDLLLGDGFEGLLDEVRIYDRALSAAETMALFQSSGGKTNETRLLRKPQLPAAAYLPWRNYVSNCVEALIQDGTDRYGPVRTDMLMSMIDVEKRTAPRNPLLLDGQVYDEGRPQRRNPAGANLWYDQATLRVMYRLSRLTGNARYAEAADRYVRDYFKYAVKPNGLLVWGSHIFYDAYADKAGGDGDGQGPHEILVYHPEWPELYRVDPKATRREIDGIWEWHIVDKRTGQHNRHDDKTVGCDFAFSGGSFALACAFMFSQTKEPVYLERAKIIADWHWRHRHPKSGLAPDAPSTEDRYDATHSFTTLTGPHASQLLRCYELTGEVWFRDVAIAYLKAYDRAAYDPALRTYYAMLHLDGTVVPAQPRGQGYDAWAPTGPVDIWKTSIFSYEFPLITAQSFVYAYELTLTNGIGDAELLTAIRRWAGLIEKQLPPKAGRRWKKELEEAMPQLRYSDGSYAEDYGRTVSFFVHAYHATKDEQYLTVAKEVARLAIDRLYVNGLFKGHPAKPYYEATNGVGILLHALMELDALPERWQNAF
ncbi:MAG TPA: LamG-like jellyroll fold domain-containing protein [Verrucomicrobiae bacterium]|nr:LamG-like jellyroll fold domain-containing protein [Verrucomicrobiae bacterium]